MTLNFSDDYVLENNRVRLEPLSTKHTLSLQTIANENQLWTYFLGRADGRANFSHYIKDALCQRKRGKEYPFAIFDKYKNNYAGSTRFFEYEKELNTIRIGYSWNGNVFRGTKLNKNTKFLMFEFAFEMLEVERIGLGAHAENTISIYAMKSLGCKKEGEIRNLFPSVSGKGRANAILMGILKQEWFESVKNELKCKL